MGRLNFRDIGDDWTPSAISIVDRPDHPLAVFEVYEDDDEFVKKSLNLEVDNMVEENNTKMVSGPVSFFEKLIGRTVVKSEEPPATAEPPKKQPEKNNESDEKILEAIQKLDAKIEKIDERVAKLEGEEGGEKPPEEPPATPDGVVTKTEGGTSDPTNNVVTKSREVDPDEVTVTKSEKSIYERVGRDSNGMTW